MAQSINPDDFVLNRKDPYEKILIEMAELSRKKSADYASRSDRFSNFRETASQFPEMTALDACNFNIAQKNARLKALRARGSTPVNESVRDTLIDRAVYSAIAVALADEK